MIHTLLSRCIGFATLGCGLIATVIYVLMITVTLAQIEAISGQVPFDMRPHGYSPSDAATLLDALGADGREYYLSRQIPLDTMYPALLALTLSSTFCWFGRRMPNKRLVHLGVAFAVGSALFDYMENLGIVAMIHGWPDVTESLVYAVSTATIAKSVITTLAVMLLLATGVIWARLPKADATA
ncbi:hypothetical protein J7399_05380 [Shimia sp. R9_1]|uniref:hypothetical protein n=1 Tax=Shimia sp. R9_1 TaxID=2821111 RepID=UPI001ADAEA49|nr:hypothetical protein [Shimia sp. R9_1]MBO9406848.1 hypothetical protein [Shimia sp. R9_1]